MMLHGSCHAAECQAIQWTHHFAFSPTYDGRAVFRTPLQ